MKETFRADKISLFMAIGFMLFSMQQLKAEPTKGYQFIHVTPEQIEILQPVFFEPGKVVIDAKSFPLLDEVAKYLRANPTIKIIVEAHSDNRGSADFNKKTTQQRAGSVVAFLLEKAIASDRLKAMGFGEERPIAPNDTEANRAKNRRIEFHRQK
jgi:OmpA-OmpF porin, OOP family